MGILAILFLIPRKTFFFATRRMDGYMAVGSKGFKMSRFGLLSLGMAVKRKVLHACMNKIILVTMLKLRRSVNLLVGFGTFPVTLVHLSQQRIAASCPTVTKEIGVVITPRASAAVGITVANASSSIPRRC
jgi:hypothetical protein